MSSLKKIGSIITIIVLTILIIFGSYYLYFKALPYINNEIHEEIIDFETYVNEELKTIFEFKYQTDDSFCATNPINVTIQTGIIENIKSIQITFFGAEKFFSGDWNFSDPDFSIQKFRETIEQYVILLDKHTKPITGITTFSGNLKNLTYNRGGVFDIGIQLTDNNGNITYKKMENAIYISPPEVLLTIRNNNIMLGLSWLGIGIALLIPGLTGIINYYLLILFNDKSSIIQKKDIRYNIKEDDKRDKRKSS